MRIAHVLKATGLSGAEAHVLELAGGLSREGFESRLIVLAEPRRHPAALVRAARSREVALDILPIAGDVDLFVVGRIANLLQSMRAQLVHTHMIHGDLFGALAARWAGVAVVQSRHNDDRFRRGPAVRLLTRWLAAQAKTVIAISDSLAAFVRDVEGVPGAKIVRIYYGLDPAPICEAARPGALRSELGLAPNVPLIGAAGRLTEQKGLRHLLEAVARARQRVTGARLLIAGDGPMRTALEAHARALGLGEVAYFLGWREDVPSIMADIDVLAVPSLWEGFGLVTLEAMALGKPIVASRVSALPEIVVDGETGLLTPPAEPGAIADALAALLADPARARAMGQAGRARLEKEFTVARMARQHAAVYREAASRVPEFRA